MQKIKFVGILAATLVLAGCGSQKPAEEAKKAESVPAQEQPQNTGYLDSMLGIKEKAAQDMQKAETVENKKINNALEQSGLNDKQTTMDYVKQYSQAIITTNFGKIKVKFYNADSPATVNNFLKLSAEKFFDGTKFHRVIPDFMIQGGDPNSRDADWSNDGQGGPGYSFKDEFNARKLIKGSLAMANSGPNTNGSQFFIVTAAATPWLDGKHTNFGEVIEGMDVVDKIQKVERNANDHPTKDVIIQGIELVK